MLIFKVNKMFQNLSEFHHSIIFLSKKIFLILQASEIENESSSNENNFLNEHTNSDYPISAN